MHELSGKGIHENVGMSVWDVLYIIQLDRGTSMFTVQIAVRPIYRLMVVKGVKFTRCVYRSFKSFLTFSLCFRYVVYKIKICKNC